MPLIHLESHWGATISMSLLILIYAEIINLTDSVNIKKKIFKTGFILGLLIMIDYDCLMIVIATMAILPRCDQGDHVLNTKR